MTGKPRRRARKRPAFHLLQAMMLAVAIMAVFHYLMLAVASSYPVP